MRLGAVRFQRCPSPRWPEAQRDVTVIPGRQRGPRAPGPRATERAKGSQPVYARVLSDTLPCSVRFMQQARNVKDPDLLLAARSYQLLPPAHARARAHTDPLQIPREKWEMRLPEHRAGPGHSVLASSPAAPRRREASGAAREERIQKKSPEESGGVRQGGRRRRERRDEESDGGGWGSGVGEGWAEAEPEQVEESSDSRDQLPTHLRLSAAPKFVGPAVLELVGLD